jgi:hypothetical protein
VIDQAEIAAMAGQIMPEPQAQPTGQAPGMAMPVPMPPPEALMAMLQGQQGGQAKPEHEGPDLAPSKLIHKIARHYADQQVSIAKSLVEMGGKPEGSISPDRQTLLSIWRTRHEDATPEQIRIWKEEEKLSDGEILKRAYPGRFFLLRQGKWRPKQRADFSDQMDRLDRETRHLMPARPAEGDGNVADSGTVEEGPDGVSL